jgi:hypothetical protein
MESEKYIYSIIRNLFYKDQNKNIKYKRLNYVIKLIDEYPESQYLSFPECLFYLPDERKCYNKIKNKWINIVSMDGNKLSVLENAATSLSLYDYDISIKLLKLCKKKDTQNPYWLIKLGKTIFRESKKYGKCDVKKAKEAFKFFENALHMLKNKKDIFNLHFNLTEAALLANDKTKAEKYSKELLKLSKSFRSNVKYYDAKHLANITLAKIYFKKNMFNISKEYFIKSSKIKGSPTLNSFGPDKELLYKFIQKKDYRVAKKYMNNCQKFWKNGFEEKDENKV